ncbi:MULTISPECIES: hypothetical protein [unclassified Roseateles]|uniref:hypothetical protein n=1 Tax=unclassified Roseateles TaxID=2626991 RepID=UPI0006FDFCE6|nr:MULTISPECIES: hypothetical protein [unclassified Roseateles]KQW52004.1 hypothetical protein ASC81_05230 [Pelomonas sp. Root405]KRA78238.1 hypothetical protein ASD88_05235 [Pelomonas sp. Root662]
MGHSDLYSETTEATRHGLQKAESAARRGLDHLGESVSGVRDAVAPVMRDVRARVVNASDRTIGYVRDEPVRSALVAAAVGTLVFAVWHMLGSRSSSSSRNWR